MLDIHNIQINYSFSIAYLIIAIVIVSVFTYYVHRVTLPPISTLKKSLIISLRSISLILFLFLIFEPVLSYSEILETVPKNYLFIDNSRSIQIEDGTNRKSTVQNIIKEFHSRSFSHNVVFNTFGGVTKSIPEDSIDQIQFDDGQTNFANIFDKLNAEEQNITSITIISDGVINDGSNPLFQAEKTGKPVFTIGIGDTSSRNDAEVKNILANNFIYSETPTQILATISNHRLSGRNTALSLFENDKLLEQKIITLSNDGVQTESFEYTPRSPGEKKITVLLGKSIDEFSDANNKKISFINVLNDKIKVLLVAGSPSSDLSFIKTSLMSDKNLNINSITQISADKFLESQNRSKLIDSADIFFLIGFPAKNSPADLIDKLYSTIKDNRKPFYFLLSGSTDLNKLKKFDPVLPFSIKRISNELLEVQPNVPIKESRNNLIKNDAENIVEEWNNLPPVYQPNSEFLANPESEVIVKSKINNLPVDNPLIISRSIGNRSISVLAKDIWKWKLQISDKETNLFDSFILNSVRWLNSDERQKKVIIKTNKKIYSPGEEIEFTAQVYDESFIPVNDALVEVKIKNNKQAAEISLSSLGSGLYEGKFRTSESGNFTFKGTAHGEGKSYGSADGSFNIGEIDVEMGGYRMDREFLSTLSYQTNGQFFMYDDYSEVFDRIKIITDQSSKEKEIQNEIALWANEWLLIILIIFLAIEWLLRKLWGLL